MRLLRQQLLHRRRKQHGGGKRQRAHHQPPLQRRAGLGPFVHRLAQLGLCQLAGEQQAFARIVQPQAAACANEQRRRRHVLQLLQALVHGRLAHAQLLCGTAFAARVHQRLQHLQVARGHTQCQRAVVPSGSRTACAMPVGIGQQLQGPRGPQRQLAAPHRGLHAAPHALKQGAAQRSFELLHRADDGRLRHMQQRSRALAAARLRHGRQGAQQAQVRQQLHAA